MVFCNIRHLNTVSKVKFNQENLPNCRISNRINTTWKITWCLIQNNKWESLGKLNTVIPIVKNIWLFHQL